MIGSEWTPGALTSLAHAAVLLAGFPVLAVLVVRLLRERGVGLPVDGAWPDVCWGRDAWGLTFTILCFALHIVIMLGVHTLSNLFLDLEGLSARDPVVGSLVTGLLVCPAWIVTCGLILLWIVRRRRARLAAVGLTTTGIARAAGRGLFVLLGVMPAVLAVLFVSWQVYTQLYQAEPRVHPMLMAAEEANAPWQWIALALLVGLVIPFLEELFYRGILQTTMMRTGRPVVAIAFPALLFGLAHLGVGDNGVSVPALTMLALGLGYAYYRTRSLWAPVAMHAVFNLYNLALTIFIPPLVQYLNKT